PYKYLSYTWGDQSQMHPIRLNGHVMQVGRNLLEFLEAAASLYAGEYLWIDALCINQNDDVDKSLQVQRMGGNFQERNR
ncbi:heterokaryon incompatibility, partial [Setomelanomma holmii]